MNITINQIQRVISFFILVSFCHLLNLNAQDSALETPILICDAVGIDFVCIDWNDIEGANNYKLIYSIGSSPEIESVISSSEYCLTGLLPGDEISLFVIAISTNPEDVADSAPALSVCSTTYPIPLTTPILSCNQTGEGSICFSWPEILGAEIYSYYYEVNGTLFPSETTENHSFCVNGLLNFDQLDFYVSAIDTDYDLTSSEASISCTASNSDQLMTPEILCTSVSESEVCFEWVPVEGAIAYNLVYSINEILTEVEIDDTNFCIGDLLPGTVVELNAFAKAELGDFNSANVFVICLTECLPSPIVWDAYPEMICLGADYPPLILSPLGGTFSGPITEEGNLLTDEMVSGPNSILYVYQDEYDCTHYSEIEIEASGPILGNPIEYTCLGTEVTFSAFNAETYLWEQVGTENTFTSSQITVTATEDMTFNLTATDANDCSVSVEANLFIVEDVFVDAGADRYICAGQGVNLVASSSLATESDFVWSDGQAGSDVYIYPFSTSTYTVFLQQGEGCFASDDITIVVSDISVDLGLDLNICAEEEVELFTPFDPELNYNWNNGSSLNSILVSPSTTSVYSVTVSDGEGCQDVDFITVNVSPVHADLGGDVIICEGETIELQVEESPFYTYAWSDAQTTPTAVFSPTSTTVYSVTIADDNNCTSVDEITVIVQICEEVFNPQNDFFNIEITSEGQLHPLHLLENDILPFGTYDFSIVESPSVGTFDGDIPSQVNSDDSLLPTLYYTADYGFDGTDSFSYELCQDLANCITVQVTLEIQSFVSDPAPPIPFPDYSTTNENTIIEIDVLANDFDLEDLIFSIESFSQPMNGTVNLSLDELYLIYTPNIDFIGEDSFTYEIINDLGLSDFTSVYVNVVPLGDIWPGDANTDGIANNYDLLTLGLAYGLTGPERFLTTSDWLPQSCEEWEESITLSNIENPDLEESIEINAKFADCNGNGLVEETDVEVIEQNYNQIHARLTGEAAADAPLIWVEMPEELEDNTWVTAYINIGTPLEEAEDMHGFAFSLYFDTAVVDLLSVTIDFSDNWLAGEENLQIVNVDPATGRVDMAFTRTDLINVTGNGRVAQASFFIIDNVDGKQEGIAFELSVQNSRLISADGAFYTMEESSALANVVTSILANQNESKVLGFGPNPAREYLNLYLPQLEEKQRVSVYNSLGELVFQWNSEQGDLSQINTSRWTNGIYFIEWRSQNQKQFYKLQVLN